MKKIIIISSVIATILTIALIAIYDVELALTIALIPILIGLIILTIAEICYGVKGISNSYAIAQEKRRKQKIANQRIKSKAKVLD